jgi:hypothetical protein
MRQFRCFFIGEDEAVETFEPIDLENEAEAVRRAERMLTSRPSAAAEIWESGRLVARIDGTDRS